MHHDQKVIRYEFHQSVLRVRICSTHDFVDESGNGITIMISRESL